MPRVIDENEWLLAVDKPAGLITHSDGRTIEPSLSEWLGEKFPNLQGVGGAWVSPQGEEIALNGIVHRLDRTTSGVILVAKSTEAFAYLREKFKERQIDKKYIALLSGAPEEVSGKIVAEIVRTKDSPRRWRARVCSVDDPRAAITEWRLLEARGTCALVEIHPKTGRTHQIRVHFSSIGYPLLGDALYGGDMSRYQTPALHALSVSLALPDGSSALYRADAPAYFSLT